MTVNAYCIVCKSNVVGKLKEIIALDSGKWLYKGECPDCLHEIKRIVLNDNSGSYNGRRAVSETDNDGPIPSPEAYE
jgi:hypothetical protein